MATLHKLLSEGGFEGQSSRHLKKKVKFKGRGRQEDSIPLPIYICHDPRSFNSSRKLSERALPLKGSSFSSSRRGDSRDVADIDDDDVIQAIVSMLSGYIGQYLNDNNFRQCIREKCSSCFVRKKKKHSDNEIFSHMEMGIQSIERLVQNQERNKGQVDIEALEKSIKILNFRASVDSNSLTEDSVSLCACTHLCLAIVYKIAKSDEVSAKYLLQVFIDAPFLARICLLPELWEHLYLPHLLHLKIWYNKELDFIANSDHGDKDKKIMSLNHKYNDQMDNGTRKFATYYMERLKVGVQPVSIPSVSLPSKPSRKKSAGSSSSSYQSIKNKSVYEAVFGASRYVQDFEEEETVLCSPKEDIMQFSHIKKNNVADWRSSSETYGIEKVKLWSDDQKSGYFGFLACRAEPDELNREKVKKYESSHLLKLSSISRSIASICSSESLFEREMAIRAVCGAWLDSEGDAKIKTSLSQASVIQGIMEVLYESNTNEILELGISLLAELAMKKKMNRKCILNSDPQLDVLIRLMTSSSLFLKAAALLYLVKPKAQQMTSTEWIPLVLRVLEFGDQVQTLFSVRCSSHEAAYYFLELLLTGFNRSKNLENAMHIISSGGLSLLVTRMEDMDTFKKAQAASILLYCIKADGSCRHYLAENLKKDNIISLFVLGRQTNTQGLAVQLLIELTCLNRSERMHFLAELMKGWNSLNTLHILLCNLQKVPHEERPAIAVLLLLLDLMGDPWGPSVYREEAIDALVTALDCSVFNEKVQQQSARALLILGGCFSYTGEPEVETWLLNKASVIDNSKHLLYPDEDRGMQTKMSIAMLTTGNLRFLIALSDLISHSIPFLSRASLVTICWLMRNLHFLGDEDLQLTACAIVVPELLECLKDNTNHEEKILASFSLHSLLKATGIIWRLKKEDIDCLDKLSHLTWTAKELTEEADTSLVDSNDVIRFLLCLGQTTIIG